MTRILDGIESAMLAPGRIEPGTIPIQWGPRRMHNGRTIAPAISPILLGECLRNSIHRTIPIVMFNVITGANNIGFANKSKLASEENMNAASESRTSIPANIARNISKKCWTNKRFNARRRGIVCGVTGPVML